MSLLRALPLLVLPMAYAIPTGDEATRLQKRDDVDFEWTAWGDSYASGVGAGTYIDGRRCLRYDSAYPVLMENGGSLPGTNRKLNNVVCSGAKTDEVLDYQFYTPGNAPSSGDPSWQYYPRPDSGKPTMGTLTIGGDDIDFPGILNSCIMEGFPWPLSQGFQDRTCDDQLTLSWSKISQNSDKTTPNTDLIANIDKVIEKILKYVQDGDGASANKFWLYVTGYPQFFNSETTLCNDITFARTANPNPDGKDHTKLTTELRTELNQMSQVLNLAVQESVKHHNGQQVKYIDIDTLLNPNHRFCEENVQEPDQNREDTWIFHYPYNQPTTEQDQNLTDYMNNIASDNSQSIQWDQSSTLYVDYINEFWTHVNEQDLDNTIDAVNNSASEIPFYAVPLNIPGVAPTYWDFWRDFVGARVQVFHPKPAYHQAINEAIIQQYLADTGTGSQSTSSLASTATSSATSSATSTAPPAATYTNTCHLHLYEYEIACLAWDRNLRANIQIWNGDGFNYNTTHQDDLNDYPPMDDTNALRLSSSDTKLPADLVVKGEHDYDYVYYTLETDPPQSWNSSDSNFCTVGGWDPRDGSTKANSYDCFLGDRTDATRQMDCTFKC